MEKVYMACDYNTVQSSVYRYRNLCVAAQETHVVLVWILCQGRRNHQCEGL